MIRGNWQRNRVYALRTDSGITRPLFITATATTTTISSTTGILHFQYVFTTLKSKATTLL